MPRPEKQTGLARLGEALADLVRDVLGALVPRPAHEPIPVRVRDRR